MPRYSTFYAFQVGNGAPTYAVNVPVGSSTSSYGSGLINSTRVKQLFLHCAGQRNNFESRSRLIDGPHGMIDKILLIPFRICIGIKVGILAIPSISIVFGSAAITVILIGLYWLYVSRIASSI